MLTHTNKKETKTTNTANKERTNNTNNHTNTEIHTLNIYNTSTQTTLIK